MVYYVTGRKTVWLPRFGVRFVVSLTEMSQLASIIFFTTAQGADG